MFGRLLSDQGPIRALSLITLVNTVGSGLWVTSMAIYLTRVAGLGSGELGVGLTIAALVSLAASSPLGYAADRVGARGLQVGWYLALAVLSAAMLLVRSFVPFVIVASFTALADAGQRGARGAMIARTIPADKRVTARAFFRSTANVGLAIGAAIAGVAMTVGNPLAYRLLVVGNAVSYLAIALLATRLPHLPPVPRAASGPRLIALRDRPFMTFVALDGAMSIHHTILSLVLPLWIVSRTSAPTWLVAAAFLLNTAMVVLLQVRAARGLDDLDVAGRASRGAGLLIGLACIVFAASASVPAVMAAALVLVGAFVHVLGELRLSAAGWAISFGLAPEQAQGQYQGTYAMGYQFGRMIAPATLTWLVLGWGQTGWVLLALGLAALGAGVPAAVRWGQLRMLRQPAGAAGR